MKQFIALRPKMYSHVTDDASLGKKTKSTKKCVIRAEINFETKQGGCRKIKQY